MTMLTGKSTELIGEDGLWAEKDTLYQILHSTVSFLVLINGVHQQGSLEHNTNFWLTW